MIKAKHISRLLLMVLMLIGAATDVLAQEYITEVMTLGAEQGEGANLRREYENKGWTVLNNDLNRNAGGWDVYIAYKTSSTANPETGYITDICASNKWVDSFTFEGRTYYKAQSNSGFNGDLNKGAGGADIIIYYTRERGKLGSYGADKRVITKLSVLNQSEDNDSWTAAISWRNSSYSGICDLNRGAGGDYIYIHQHFTTQKVKWSEKPTFASDLVYNGQTQNLIAKDTWKNNYGTLKYRVDGGSWSCAVPGAIDVGNYKVEAQLEGTSASGIVFANNSDVVTKTVTINPPLVKAANLHGVFNQGDKRVYLSWDIPSVPGNYTNFKWVVYRDGTKIAELAPSVHTYADDGFANESSPTYDVYYVSNFWDLTTQRDDTKATVTVNTTREVPVRNLKVEQQSDRIVFTWASDAYPKGFGHKFRIYVDGEEDPIYTLTPDDMQDLLQWEHRTTDQHSNRQNKVDPETGVPYTEEPLNACAPKPYRIEGVIGDAVLNTMTINPKAIGEATKFYSLDASKGSYEGAVKLSWHVDQQGSLYAKTYIVERRRAEQQEEAWEVLTRLSSNEDYLFYTDETALPGVYYDYRITVEDKCDDGSVLSNEVTSIGFAKSTGTVTGRIAYGSTGTAVQGVDVVMNMTSSEGDQIEQFHSMYFTGVNGAVTWQYPVGGNQESSTKNYATEKFATGDFSMQIWLNPESFNETTIVDFGNGIGLGMTASGGLTFNNQPFDGIVLQQDVYNHVALTRKGKTLTCYVLTQVTNSSEPKVQKATLTLTDGSLALTNAEEFSLGHFKGSADEFRLWTRCLSEADILENFDHLLVGDESGLETYWTFDEGLRTQLFDYSRDGTNYHKHHGLVGSNAQPSTLTPTALKLKAKTNADGNYVIQGIPFTGEGTTYSVVPLFGIHEFNPAKTLLFVGKNALVHTANFEDVSSFPMSGHIYYAGTNVPVEGVQIYVDGLLQNKDGQVVQSESDGKYNISVPIGQHFIEAKLGGHTMVAGGRWPTAGTFHFDRPVQYDFADSTLVNFVGRVGGGLSNDTLAVGFNLSKNNIGIATIQLALNNESFSLNCQDDHISNALTVRTWQSDTTSISSQAYTGTDYDAKYITIRTDSLTGEFSALLPPLKYKVKSINVKSGIDFGTLPEIDLTSVSQEQTDSITEIFDDGKEQKQSYTYNTKMVKTYFADPQLELIQMSVNGEGDAPKGVFGRKAFEDFSDDFGAAPIDNIWTINESGKPTYTYGYPIYDGGDKVKMRVWGYEVYVNHDPEPALPAVADTIPLNGQVVTVSNEMSSEQMVVARVDNESLGLQPGDIYDLKQDQLILDTRGMNEFTFITGLPNIVAPYTRQLSMEMERNNRTYTYDGVNAIVLGSLTTGTNFVTLGPDLVTMVLRDPPGATSKTTWKTGHTETKFRSSSQGFYGNEKFTLDNSWGLYLETEVGVGIAAVSSKTTTLTNTTAGFTYRVQRNNQTDQTWSTTVTEAVSSGTKTPYVGSKGDVFIGASTNIIIGDARKLGFFRDGGGYPLRLDLRNTMSMGDSIRTTFMYSTYELEEVMIPKWKATRQSLMTFLPTKEEALNYVNTSDHCVYVTWLKPDDEALGTDTTTYRQLPPVNWDGTFIQDSVLWCTNQIKSWKKLLSDNEEDKVIAMNDPKYFVRNISFDGGNNYTYANRTDTTFQKKHNYSHNLGGIVKFGGTSQSVIGGVAFNVVAMWDTENGWSMATSESDPDENYKDWAELEYAFSDGNKGTDFSVNIYKSPSGWGDIFSILGGQSYNPYEGEEKTKYFEEGMHILSNGTEQMERPNIRISLDGNGDNSAKHVTLSDVPAGQPGQLTLHLTNLSSTTQGFDFSYNIMVQEKANQMGLEVLMDGVPANGRSIFIPAGETVKKVITVRQTDQSVLDYTDLEIWLMSQFQPIKINDKVTFNVHFKPSSSPSNLAITDPVLNIETLDRNKGDLELKVTGFDRQFKGMKKLGVEYRYEGSTTWTRPDTLNFFVNRADSTKLHDQVLPATGDLLLRFNMKDDNLYPQGNYTFRAYTTTMYGAEDISVYSSEVNVVKDNVRPRNLTTPEPTDGILRYGDDIIVEFNEDIVPGYVSDKNIIVTAKLNNQPIQHDVALQLIPYGVTAHTKNPVFLNGDFSIEFWVKWTQGGHILRWGEGLANTTMSIDNSGHFVILVGGNSYISTAVLPKDTWTFIAASYKASDLTFSALGQYDTESVLLFDHQPVTFSSLESFLHSGDHAFYLGGGVTAAIHDLALYDIYRDVYEAGATKYVSKDQYTYGLANYWPMNEGHGTVAADSRHTHDFEVTDRWELSNVNYSFDTTSSGGLTADISRINTSAGDSYAIEFWAFTYKNAVTLFETGSNASNKICLRYDDEMNLLLDYGEKSQVVASHNDFPLHDSWHHMALNVVRGQAASFYYNGQRTAVIAEVDMPPLEGSQIKIGTNNDSHIDELRIWHASLTEDRLLANMYNCIDTTDIYSRGLVAYYPFEKRETVNGVLTYVGTLEDMAPANTIPGHAVTADPSGLVSFGPPLKKAPEESRLIARQVASERKIVVRLDEGSGVTARDVEGATLNITIDKIHDMHGNESLPIRWQAYCYLNTLKWTKDSVNVIKRYGDDYTFDVNIENRGGHTEYYTLYNMPQWLTLINSYNTDDIAPQKTKTLRFQVNPLVAVGNYDITIGLQGNNGILEPLRIVMKVRGEAPNWSVDPNAYENNMSIVGQIYINGILMSNSESILAAFIDDECRGVASPKQMRGAAYVPMSIYGTSMQQINGVPADLDRGRTVTFRLWDASTGIAYPDVSITMPDGTVTDTLTFDPTKNYGTFNEPIIFTKTDLVEQHLALRKGWNWISLGVEPSKPKVAAVFKDVTSWEARLKDHDTGTAYCNGTYWAGTLKQVKANTMYKLLLTELEQSKDLPPYIVIKGQQIKLAETPDTLKKGWNWLPYTPATTMSIGEALAGANPKFGDQVKAQTAFAYYGPYGWEGDLDALENGKGYLYMSTDTLTKTFVYPSASLSSLAAQSPKANSRRVNQTSVFTPVPPTDYPDNMTMVVLLTNGGIPVADAEVAAFVDGECRGAAVATTDEEQPLYYLLIAGEGSGQPMQLRVYLDGSIITLSANLVYSSDGNIGTPWEPYVIDISDALDISSVEDVDGSPSAWYSLQGIYLGTTKPTTPGIYLCRTAKDSRQGKNGRKIVIKGKK